MKKGKKRLSFDSGFGIVLFVEVENFKQQHENVECNKHRAEEKREISWWAPSQVKSGACLACEMAVAILPSSSIIDIQRVSRAVRAIREREVRQSGIDGPGHSGVVCGFGCVFAFIWLFVVDVVQSSLMSSSFILVLLYARTN